MEARACFLTSGASVIAIATIIMRLNGQLRQQVSRVSRELNLGISRASPWPDIIPR